MTSTCQMTQKTPKTYDFYADNHVFFITSAQATKRANKNYQKFKKKAKSSRV